jgi:tetratricopeptide (TPR) repeat protein
VPPGLAEEVARCEQAATNALAQADNIQLLTGAIPGAERALEIRQTHQGDTWWETVLARQQLLDLRRLQASNPEIRAQYLTVYKLDLQMEELAIKGDYQKALELAQTVRDLRKEVLGEEHPDYAASLNNVAVCLQLLGRLSETLPAFEAVLALRQRLFPADHPELANSLNNVAFSLKALGRWPEALPKYEAALAMLQRLHGGDHRHVALAMNNVAACLEFVGRSAEALPQHEAALAMRQRLFKGDHRYVAISLDNLAACLTSLGRPAEALPRHEAALAMRQRLFKDDHPDVARSLNGVAACLVALDRPAEALPRYEAALALRQRLNAGDHPDTAASLNNLGYCLEQLDRWEEALSYYEAALAMWQRLLKGDHPAVAKVLNNLGHCLQGMDRPSEALPKYEQALAMRQRLFENDHPDVAQALSNLARCLWAVGRRDEAARRLLESAQAHWRHLTRNFPTLSDPQKRQLLSQLDFDQGEALAGLLFQGRGVDSALGLRGALLSKQLLFEVARQEHGALLAAHALAPPSWQALWQEREQLRRQYAALALQGLSEAGLQTSREERSKADPAYVRSLAGRIEQLEQQLRVGNPAYAQAARLPEASLEDVAAALRADEALVEYVRYRDYDPVARAWGSPRYGAFVLARDKTQVAAIALGRAETIDQLVDRLRSELGRAILPFKSGVQPSPAQLRRSAGEIARASSALRARVWAPLETPLSGMRRVYLAPDGALSLVPLEALALESAPDNWRYLAEDRELVYLGTGRDLARLALKAPAEAGQSTTIVLIGNPAFSAEPEQLAIVVAGLRPPAPILAQTDPQVGAATLGSTTPAQARRLQIPRDWSRDPALDRLLEQARQQLTQLGWRVTCLTNELAVEEAALNVTAPRVLQFATHGHILSRPDADPGGWDNPLLRSMLLLAGANRWQPERAVFCRVGNQLLSREQARRQGLSEEQIQKDRLDLADGILTAYEVTGMNLRGTELVNLTACETGLGEVTPDGVAGLRQAFLLAGARSLTMSMWEVPAVETTRQIADFYTRWLGRSPQAGPGSRYVAFRAAQLAALAHARNTHGAAHPFHWAGVVYVGDPGDLPRPPLKAN